MFYSYLHDWAGMLPQNPLDDFMILQERRDCEVEFHHRIAGEKFEYVLIKKLINFFLR